MPDPVTGFLHMGLRDYDPATGRFTGRDPLLFEGGQANLFAYASNNPARNSDPIGLFSIDFTICEGICVGTKLTINGDGISACTEAGFGEGGVGLEVGSAREARRQQGLPQGGARGVAGPFASLELSGEVNSDGCKRDTKKQAKVCIAGACFTPEEGITVTDDMLKLLKADTKLGVDGKVVAGVCQNAKWYAALGRPALELEQRALHLDAARVAGERAVGADDPVAGDDHRDRVAPVRAADGPACARRPTRRAISA